MAKMENHIFGQNIGIPEVNSIFLKKAHGPGRAHLQTLGSCPMKVKVEKSIMVFPKVMI